MFVSRLDIDFRNNLKIIFRNLNIILSFFFFFLMFRFGKRGARWAVKNKKEKQGGKSRR